MIYIFFNFVKSNFDPNSTISGENFLWFGSTFFINSLFAIIGILCFFNYEKYFATLKFWCVYKLFFVVFTTFLLFYGALNIKTYFFMFSPIDFFFFVYLFLLIKETKISEEHYKEENKN
ncbi:MAG: hypothetical protein A2Y34_11535 [Spirochaetes bacterium GWC1_27_15]|nr:MAG: hypothetical protein A2Z98_08335 [Spirochaetes bacterium GWB1_27_13]OHD23297.1 MAG: hypothetical protein A2Y34_11535 [Spirochaetes bacterium GWC1_27_15]